MTRSASLLALAMAALTVSCAGLGATRGLALVLVAAAGALTWVAHRRAARAGGTGGVDDTTGTDTTGQQSGSASGGETSSDAGTSTSPDTAATDTGTSTSTEPEPTAGEVDSGPCLSIGMPDPEMGACLCACDTQGDDGEDWAPALLLPLLVRRRSRREALEHVADEGRLPPDVIARLRRRLDDDDGT